MASSQSTKRSANWTSQEDEQLCKSWVHISEDPIRANQMKRDQFWDRATADFNKYAPSGAREAKSLMHRWGHLQKATLKFCGIYSHIEANPPSGSAPSDRMRSAKESYLDETGKHFAFESSWLILRDVGKWKALVAPKPTPTPTLASSLSQTPTPSTQATPVTNSSNIETRPMGSKAAKRELGQSEFLKRKLRILEHNSKQTKERVAEFKRSNDLQERLIEADLLKAEADLRAQRLLFMQKDPKDCPNDLSREFLMLEKKCIVEEMHAEASKRASTSSALQATTNTAEATQSKSSTQQTPSTSLPGSPIEFHFSESDWSEDKPAEALPHLTSETNPEDNDVSQNPTLGDNSDPHEQDIDPMLHIL